MMALKSARLVSSIRGAKGGFIIARPPKDITVSQILAVAEGPLALAPCEADRCTRKSGCGARLLWTKAEELLNGLFSAANLADLADRTRMLEEARTHGPAKEGQVAESWGFEI